MRPLHIFLVVSTTMAPQLGLLTGCAGNGSTTGGRVDQHHHHQWDRWKRRRRRPMSLTPVSGQIQAIFTGELDGQPFDTIIPTTGLPPIRATTCRT